MLKNRFTDPLWRIQNIYLIRDKNRHLVPMRFNSIQKRLSVVVADSLDHKKPIRHMDLKYRQGGISTFWILYYLDNTLFTPNTITCILAQQKESLKYLWDIVRSAHMMLPDRIKPKCREDSAHTLYFEENNSKIMVSLKLLSTTVHNLHVSEYPRCDPIEIEQSLAAAPPNANITLEGVANGINHAYDKWHSKDEYTRLFHPWYLQEEYKLPVTRLTRTEEETILSDYALHNFNIVMTDEQMAWRRQKKNELKQLFYQEYAEDADSCFMSSGNPFFNARKIAKLLKTPEFYVEQTDEYEQYEKPANGHIYVAGADSAQGLSDGDYSVLAIICVTCRRQAFRYRARVNVDKFFHVCDYWGRLYNKALLAPEVNNTGHAVILGLQAMQYPYLYLETPIKNSILGLTKTSNNRQHGWNTNTVTRPVMLEQIRQAVEGNFDDDENNFMPEIAISDQIFLRECLTFHNVDGKLEALAGKHDDCIFAWAIALQMYILSRPAVQRQGSNNFLVGGQSEASRLFKS